MKGYYTQKNNMERTSEVGLFQPVLDFNWEFIYYEAHLAYEQRRNSILKPKDMPIEDNVK